MTIVNLKHVIKQRGEVMELAVLKEKAEYYREDMTKLLRDLVRIPGESGNEKNKIDRAAEEMRRLGFDKVDIDAMGNLLGYMGTGKTLIAFDGHMDTVGIGSLGNWDFDPYEGYENETEIGGRGTSDQEGGIVAAIYAAKIMKDCQLLNDQYTALVTATVQEEPCEGLCWRYIIEEDKVCPDFVVLTEPSDGKICRGHRGRMEIRVEAQGISCHGSAPEWGENAIYKMAAILLELEKLNERLKWDDFLGKGTLTISEIVSGSPSRCAVADSCVIYIDRRITTGETKESVLAEIRNLPTVQTYDANVEMCRYEQNNYTGLAYGTECYFPAWVTQEEHNAVQAMSTAHRSLYGEAAIDKWTFSTNGVSIMGRYGIPCVGFGPGKEAEAHAPNEKTWKVDLVKCAAVYAALPVIYHNL